MKNKILITLSAMTIAAIWGYFTDLKSGNVAGFISRIFFVSAAVLGFQISMGRAEKKEKDKEKKNIKNNVNKKKR
ncbi:hypothetical protein [Clostridium rectalis]|uniref:hypothetical protein n=1 Tax=Clostridium rectalis TaxID=2040295 RepID=UPI000F637E4D|nr:hypothetical protein [Clostridium rectalis]